MSQVGILRALYFMISLPFNLLTRIIYAWATITGVVFRTARSRIQSNSFSIEMADHAISTCSSEEFHIKQSYEWDCGIACCEMMLCWLRGDLLLRGQLRISYNKERPLWTIEIFALLRDQGAEVRTPYRIITLYFTKK